jgi:hypothetical protein
MDTIGSTESNSTDELFKIFMNKNLNIYAACADVIERAAEIFPVIERLIGGIPNNVFPDPIPDDPRNKRNHGAIQAALATAAYSYKVQRFQLEVLPMFAWNGSLSSVDQKLTLGPWQQFNFRSQLIVAAFEENGRGHLYLIAQYEDAPGSFSSVTASVAPPCSDRRSVFGRFLLHSEFGPSLCP